MCVVFLPVDVVELLSYGKADQVTGNLVSLAQFIGMLALFLMFVMSGVVNEITCALATIIQEMTLEEQRKAILALKTEKRKLVGSKENSVYKC